MRTKTRDTKIRRNAVYADFPETRARSFDLILERLRGGHHARRRGHRLASRALPFIPSSPLSRLSLARSSASRSSQPLRALAGTRPPRIHHLSSMRVVRAKRRVRVRPRLAGFPRARGVARMRVPEFGVPGV